MTEPCPSDSIADCGRLRTRAASVSDAAAIAEIYNEGIADRVATFETEPRSPAEIAAWFSGPNLIVVAETEATGPVAFAASFPYSEQGLLQRYRRILCLRKTRLPRPRRRPSGALRPDRGGNRKRHAQASEPGISRECRKPCPTYAARLRGNWNTPASRPTGWDLARLCDCRAADRGPTRGQDR